MSLISYSDLQTQVANWLARSDLTAFIPDMITLFEAAAARRLRVRPGTAFTSLSTTNGSVALPSDFLGMIGLTWEGTPETPLNYVHPTLFTFYDPNNNTTGASAPPQNYTLRGSTIYIDPIDDTGLTIQYYQKAGAVATILNWLWTNHPDAYLFGTLAEANAFNKNIPNAVAWKTRRDEVFDEIQMQEFRERSNMAVAIKGLTP